MSEEKWAAQGKRDGVDVWIHQTWGSLHWAKGREPVTSIGGSPVKPGSGGVRLFRKRSDAGWAANAVVGPRDCAPDDGTVKVVAVQDERRAW